MIEIYFRSAYSYVIYVQHVYLSIIKRLERTDEKFLVYWQKTFFFKLKSYSNAVFCVHILLSPPHPVLDFASISSQASLLLFFLVVIALFEQQQQQQQQQRSVTLLRPIFIQS